MQKIIHGFEDWWIELPYTIKKIYFNFIGRDYYVYIGKRYNNPVSCNNLFKWKIIDPVEADSIEFPFMKDIYFFDTLVYYGDCFKGGKEFDFTIDKDKISNHFEYIDRTDPYLVMAIEQFYSLYPKLAHLNSSVMVTTLPDNIDWKIYTGQNGIDEGFREYVEQPHLVYLTDGTAVDLGYKKFEKRKV